MDLLYIPAPNPPHPIPTLPCSFQWTVHPHQPQDRRGPAPLRPRAGTEQHCLISRCGSGLVPAAWEALLGQLFSAQLCQEEQGRQQPCGRDVGYSHHNQKPGCGGRSQKQKASLQHWADPGALCQAGEDGYHVRFWCYSLGNAWMKGRMERMGTLTLCPSGPLGISLCSVP